MNGPAAPPVFCTDFAACNALGSDARTILARLNAGVTGLSDPRLVLPFETKVGQLEADLPALAPDLARYESRLARMAMLLAQQLRPAVDRAIARWGGRRVAVVLATSTGGLNETEAAHEAVLHAQQLPPGYGLQTTHSLSATAELLAQDFAVQGPAYVVSTACSSSAKSLASAHRLIAAGAADAVIAGGLDTLCQLTLRGFHSLGILSPTACRPFGHERNGINIGEGGALLLLERAGAPDDVALLGSGEGSDAHHMSSPDPNGQGAERAMRAALAQGNRRPADVGYINSHGTGTVFNDEAEALAIARVFGEGVAVASTKGYTGHMLGAAGATEAVFSIAALVSGIVPTSLGSHPTQAELGIRVTAQPEALLAPCVLSNSFAFGGSNISLLFGRAHV